MLQRLYLYTCPSVHGAGGGGGGIPTYLAGLQGGRVGIPACLAGGIPACLAGLWGGLQAHTRGEVEGSGRGGLETHTWEVFSRPTPGGGSSGPHPLQAHTQGVSPGPHPGECVSQHALRQPPIPPSPLDAYCHSRYVSYWNAFLYY